MKKIFFFIIGFYIIPIFLGMITAYLFDLKAYDIYNNSWGKIYLLTYIFFPLIYRKKIKQSINKYTLYAIIYSIIFIAFSLVLTFK